MHRTLFNLVAFQLGWFACVLGGSLTGGLVAGVIIVAHLVWLAQPGEWRWLVGFALLGLAIDGSLALAGGFIFAEPAWLPLPLWLWVLWPLFATLLKHSLAWLWNHRWLAVLGGAISGPLSYFGGAQLSNVELAPWLLPVEALVWALLCWWLSQRLGGTEAGPAENG
ncbi:MAG TPA: DUF2878 domain-containing protein [Modicisalibacter sp.]|nr:DUF2878 domain-containing protein [Modicisalibacter sp.]